MRFLRNLVDKQRKLYHGEDSKFHKVWPLFDAFEAFLFAPAGRWADVIVPMRRFLKTDRGRVMEHEYEMSASRVTGLGLAVANHSDTAGGAGGGSSGSGDKSPSAPVGVSGGEGPFRLEIASIVGLRLDDEALEMAKRREEARWG